MVSVTLIFVISDDARHLWHFGKSDWINLRGTSCHDDGFAGIVLVCAPDGLARRTHRFGCHGTRVYNHRIVEACTLRMAAHHLRFVGVEAATQRNDVWCRCGQFRRHGSDSSHIARRRLEFKGRDVRQRLAARLYRPSCCRNFHLPLK